VVSTPGRADDLHPPVDIGERPRPGSTSATSSRIELSAVNCRTRGVISYLRIFRGRASSGHTLGGAGASSGAHGSAGASAEPGPPAPAQRTGPDRPLGAARPVASGSCVTHGHPPTRLRRHRPLRGRAGSRPARRARVRGAHAAFDPDRHAAGALGAGRSGSRQPPAPLVPRPGSPGGPLIRLAEVLVARQPGRHGRIVPAASSLLTAAAAAGSSGSTASEGVPSGSLGAVSTTSGRPHGRYARPPAGRGARPSWAATTASVCGSISGPGPGPPLDGPGRAWSAFLTTATAWRTREPPAGRFRVAPGRPRCDDHVTLLGREAHMQLIRACCSM